MMITPRRSTTHKEQYAHIRLPAFDRWAAGTVFVRLEDEGWFASVALCIKADQFSRRVGRTVARRKYMNSKGEVPLEVMSGGNIRHLDTPRDQVPTYEDMKAVYLKECARMVGV